MGSGWAGRAKHPASGPAAVADLIEMMNRRADVVASYAQDPDVLRLLNGAEGGHMFLLTERGLRSYIDLDPSKAARATVFHEWLHRCFGRRGIQFDTVDAEHAAIEAFLNRRKILLGID